MGAELSSSERLFFRERGYLRLEQAVPRTHLEPLRKRISEELGRRGFRPVFDRDARDPLALDSSDATPQLMAGLPMPVVCFAFAENARRVLSPVDLRARR